MTNSWKLNLTTRHSICKVQKSQSKRKILKDASLGAGDGGKNFIYRGTRLRIITSFSSETKKARKQWNKIFKMLKEKPTNQEFCNQYVKSSFKSEGEIETFSKKNWEILLPGELPCKKRWKEFSRKKENDMGQKLRSA